MNYLVLIPARGGSKGIPKKNIKLLNGKPLIGYTIEVARQLFDDQDICISTDSIEIKEHAEKMGLSVPFLRPGYLATDQSSSFDVIVHAVEYYRSIGRYHDAVVLLQPTSPFRTKKHLEEALNLYNSEVDMVVSVKKTKANPYFNLFEENEAGYLQISKQSEKVTTRQTAPGVYEYNGAIYVINIKSLLTNAGLADFKSIKKYIMDEIHSLDIDEPLDWDIAELVLSKGLNK